MGEIVLHKFLKKFKNTIPLISKMYFKNHRLLTIQASDVNALSGSNAIPTAGADVLSTAARLRRERWGIAVRSRSCNRYSVESVAGDEDVAQIVFEHKG